MLWQAHQAAMQHRRPHSKSAKHRHRHVPATEPSFGSQSLMESSRAFPESQALRWRPCCLMLGLVAGLVAALYGWTADFPLVFDDLIYLRDNPLLTDSRSFAFASYFYEFANRPGKLGLDPDLATNFVLRPVAYLTFHINYIFGGFSPRWYRIFNIAIHIANAALLYGLLSLLLRQASGIVTVRRASVTFVSAAAALWFAVHPLATESVTFVVQRFTSLSAFFFLLTLLLYLAAQAREDRGQRRWLTAAATFVLVLGMLTKECCFTAPFMAILLDWLVRRTRFRTALARALPLLLCLPIIPTLLLLVTWAQHGGTLNLSAAINIVNLKDDPTSPWDYAVTQLTVVVGYLRLLAWPTGQNLDHDWPLYHSLLQGPVAGALGVILLLLASTWWFMRRHHGDPRAALVFVSVLWFFITISVSSSIVPLPDLMAEHRCYLPSIGFFMAVACLLDWVQTRPVFAREARILAPAICAVAALALCMATFQRNEVWRTRISLWEDAVSKSPGKYRVWGNLGASYAEFARYQDAERCYTKAKEVDPGFLRAYIYLGTLALVQDHAQQAFDVSMEAIQKIPNAGESVEIQYNVGIALLGLGRLEDGALLLKEIVQHIPDHRDSHYALGKYYWHQERYVKALDHWRRAALLKAPNVDLPQLITRAEARVLR